ncbi:acyl carrier protein [bacterium]|nr:acyl carrier protein [bacterium]
MRDKVVAIIQDNRPDIDDVEHAEFVTDGLLDSFDIVTLVAEFDKTFGISIDGADITPDNFNSIDSIIEMLKKNGAQ